MIPLLCVYALVVPLEVCLPDESLVAAFHGARKWIFPLLIVCFHVGFVVVASAEELAASLDLAPEIGLFTGGEATSVLSRHSPPSLPCLSRRIHAHVGCWQGRASWGPR
jgi:hypothetical protein